MKEDVFAYIDDHKAQMMDLWQDLVNQDSPASYREGVDLVAKRVFKELEEAGASTRWDEEGKALIAEIPGDSRAPVLLLGHMDTVFPVGEAARRPFTVEGSRVTGPGALDMKGGVAVMLSALKALHSAGFSGRPLKVILVSDAESITATPPFISCSVKPGDAQPALIARQGTKIIHLSLAEKAASYSRPLCMALRLTQEIIRARAEVPFGKWQRRLMISRI